MKSTYPKPINEGQRLQSLYDYDILDTISEKEYDSISKIAAEICNVPVSLVGFLDKKRQWYKSNFGIELKEIPREIAFCNYTILDPDNVLVIPDMRVDERFANHPLVVGEPRAVFYAGASLVTPNGNALGTICVLDAKINNLNENQRGALKCLAEQLMTRLELRKKIKHLSLSQKDLKKANKGLKEFAHIASHDMKIPLANISLMSKSFLIRYENILDENATGYLSIIDRSAEELLLFIDAILTKSEKISRNTVLKKHVDSYEVINKVIKLIAPPDDIEITVTGNFPKLQIDKICLQQVFQNLITNAIKYNDKEKGIIEISSSSDARFHYFDIADNGTGITKQDVSKIFKNRKTLDKTDRYGNKGTGTGLARVKELIENNGGKISVTSSKNTGSVFKISLPFAMATAV